MSVRKSGSRAVSLKSSALPEAIRPAQCWSLGSQYPTRSGRLKARTCWRMTSGWKSGLDSSAICLAAGYAATEKSRAYWRCGKSGPRAGKADRKMEDRTTSVRDLSVSSFQAVCQARISPPEGRMQKARAKPPKATPKPYSRHILGIDSGVQSHPKATPKPPQGLLIANRLGPQSHTNATLKPLQGYTKAIPKPHQSQGGGAPGLLCGAVVKPPVEAVQAERGEAVGWSAGHTGNLHRLEFLVVRDFHPAGKRAVGEVDNDDKLVFVIRAHEGDQVRFIGVMQPDDAVVGERRVLLAQLDQALVNLAQGRAVLRMPEDWQLLE